jgi:hypothetical protein
MVVQPQNQPPLFEVKKALDHGVTNPIVARLTLQTAEILERTTLSKETHDKFSDIFMSSLVQKLLRCFQIEQRLRADWEKSVASFEPPRPGAAAVEVPQILRLREDCEEFLYSAKNFLRDLMTVFSALHGLKYKDASEWTPVGKRTDSVLTYAQKKYGENHVNAKYFAQLPACVMPFVDMRNAVEHPGGHSGTLIVENIALRNGRELVPPVWRRENDSAIAYGPLPIIDDMRIAINNLLILAEDVVVMWAIDHLDPPNTMEIVAIPEAKRDPRCAIKYKATPSAALLQKIVAAQAAKS